MASLRQPHNGDLNVVRIIRQRAFLAVSKKTHNAIQLPNLRDGSQRKAFLMHFTEGQDRSEARVLVAWLLTNDHMRLIQDKSSHLTIRRGPNPPDFLLSANQVIAVEITRLVLPRKAIYDKTDQPPGAYTSTLRSDKPDAAFHDALKKGTLPDNSDVAPHYEKPLDLDHDYYARAEPLLNEKIAAAKHYSSLYAHCVILVEDSLSELEVELKPRLPRLRSFVQSVKLPSSIEVLIMNTGFLQNGVVHRL